MRRSVPFRQRNMRQAELLTSIKASPQASPPFFVALGDLSMERSTQLNRSDPPDAVDPGTFLNTCLNLGFFPTGTTRVLPGGIFDENREIKRKLWECNSGEMNN